MTRNSILLKSITHLLLGVIMYMHVCSAWCAAFSGGCCAEETDQSNRSACKRENKSKHQTGDCQDYHLSFFSATGQFASEKNMEVSTIFPTLIGEISWAPSPIIIETGQNPQAFHNYHPPPPIADIRIFIQSFQI